MKVRQVIKSISTISEAHFKIGSYYLIVENEGERLRCLLYFWREYRYGGDPLEITCKKPEEIEQYLNELKRRFGVEENTEGEQNT